jgi:hypothetical protein
VSTSSYLPVSGTDSQLAVRAGIRVKF